jgi:spore coat protein U-like protein
MQTSKTYPENFAMMFKKTLLAAAMIAFGGIALNATAATAPTATFQVKINILSACSVTAGSGSDIDFGSVAANTTVGGASLAKSNNISVLCSSTTPYIVGLATVVANGGGDAGNGFMAGTDVGNTGDKVPYTLHQVSATGAVWGNTGTVVGTPGNDYVGIGSGIAQLIPVFAVVTDPNHKPGNYADTVTVKVTY